MLSRKVSFHLNSNDIPGALSADSPAPPADSTRSVFTNYAAMPAASQTQAQTESLSLTSSTNSHSRADDSTPRRHTELLVRSPSISIDDNTVMGGYVGDDVPPPESHYYADEANTSDSLPVYDSVNDAVTEIQQHRITTANQLMADSAAYLHVEQNQVCQDAMQYASVTDPLKVCDIELTFL